MKVQSGMDIKLLHKIELETHELTFQLYMIINKSDKETQLCKDVETVLNYFKTNIGNSEIPMTLNVLDTFAVVKLERTEQSNHSSIKVCDTYYISEDIDISYLLFQYTSDDDLQFFLQHIKGLQEEYNEFLFFNEKAV